MTLAKPILVLALTFAAAILFPMRRAHAAFGPRTSASSLSVAPKRPLRRRPSLPHMALRRETTPRCLTTVTQASLRTPAADVSKPSPAVSSTHRAGELADGSRHASPSVERPQHGADTSVTPADDCDQMIDRVRTALQPELSGTIRPAAAFVLTDRAVDDIPKPPPRHAAL